MRKRTTLGLLGAVLAATLVVGATTGCGSKKKSSGKAKISIQIFPADTNAAAALLAGKVDAYFADATPVLYYMKKNPGKFEVAGKQIGAAPEGIAVRALRRTHQRHYRRQQPQCQRRHDRFLQRYDLPTDGVARGWQSCRRRR
jgi:hypothetical protein